MLFEDMLKALAAGEKCTRLGWHEQFVLLREGQLLKGCFMGETGFAKLHAYCWTEADRGSDAWRVYVRVLPDDWVGCDAG